MYLKRHCAWYKSNAGKFIFSLQIDDGIMVLFLLKLPESIGIILVLIILFIYMWTVFNQNEDGLAKFNPTTYLYTYIYDK